MKGINNLQLKKASLILKSLNNKLRQEIIELLEQDEKIIATEIPIRLGKPHSTVFQEMRALIKTQLIQKEHTEKNTYYFINKQKMAEVGKMLASM
jgi:predicted transcriptional regulator